MVLQTEDSIPLIHCVSVLMTTLLRQQHGSAVLAN